MIGLDFSIVDPTGGIDRRELARVTAGAIALALFECTLTFDVDGVDLSWDEDIPMVDFARSLYLAVAGLTDQKQSASFISVDLLPSWRLQLANQTVEISRLDLARTAHCERAVLLHAVAGFGVRVFDAALELVPELRENASLRAWYPYEGMRGVVHA